MYHTASFRHDYSSESHNRLKFEITIKKWPCSKLKSFHVSKSCWLIQKNHKYRRSCRPFPRDTRHIPQFQPPRSWNLTGNGWLSLSWQYIRPQTFWWQQGFGSLREATVLSEVERRNQIQELALGMPVCLYVPPPFVEDHNSKKFETAVGEDSSVDR